MSQNIDITEKTNEETIRDYLQIKLRRLGWEVYPEVWVTKNNKPYRVDLLAHHNSFAKLGWFVFEIKRNCQFFQPYINGFGQIINRYLGCKVNDFDRPFLKNITPNIFCYTTMEDKWQSSYETWHDGAQQSIQRFFFHYGIGICFIESGTMYFHANYHPWATLNIDTTKISRYFDADRFLKYYEPRKREFYN
jgi:hypothetical protein